MKPKRSHFEKLYENYPDVVDLQQFREMLGGIADSTARKLMQGDYVEHFVVKGTYLIPKTCVIDYVMSPHYNALKVTLKHQIKLPALWDNEKKKK